MIRTLKVAGIFVFLAALLAAADVNGKWTGSVDTPDGAVPVTFNLTANGEAVTGTVISSATKPSTKIADGKIEGDVVTFSFVAEHDGAPIKLLCKGEVTADGLKMQMGTEDGGWSAEFLAKKAS
jgi:hypothetical protein